MVEPVDDIFDAPKEPLWKRALPIVGALLLVVIIFGWVLPQFIDYGAVFRKIGEVSLGEWILLLIVATIRLIPEGWIYSAALPGIKLTQGISQFLVTMTLNNIPPGGLDLVARYQMARSWGIEATTAGTATVGTWFFMSLPRLLLPVVAVGFLALRRIRDETLDSLALLGIGVLVFLCVLLVVLFRSEKFALWMGRSIGRLANFALGLFRKEVDVDFEALVSKFKDESLDLVRRRGRAGFPAGLAAQIALFLVLLMSVYVVGLTNIDWEVVFAAFSVVAILGAIPIFNAPGLAEATYIAILGLAVGGDKADEVAAAVFVFRILTWLLPMALGGVAYSRWRTWVTEQRATSLSEDA